ncbi:MAG: DUF4349 domain-containing protein [Lachnospiraceae bacterium]|nr:DUF4349 domain-containing protein [Lachnospiraceae bacterium]
MKKRSIRTILPALLLTSALVLGGCGASGGSSSANYAKGDYAAATEAPAESYDGGYYAEEAYESGFDEELAEAEAAAYGENEKASRGEKADQGEDVKAAKSEEKLVYTCSINMETLTFAETEAKIRESIAKYKGTISSESASDGNYRWYYEDGGSGTKSLYMTISIPTKDYRNFLKDLEGAGGSIRSTSMNVENITRRYNDQSVRIQALETQEKRLLEMMDKAETIKEMITVEDRLTEVQTELNQARTTLSVMDHDVAYSTISLNLQEVVRYTENKITQTFGERIVSAFTNSFADFGDFLEDLSIALIYLLPYLLLIAVIVLIVGFLTRKGRAERRARRAEERAAKAAFREEMRSRREEERLKKDAEKKGLFPFGKKNDSVQDGSDQNG